jgi:hypothetical protein
MFNTRFAKRQLTFLLVTTSLLLPSSLSIAQGATTKIVGLQLFPNLIAKHVEGSVKYPQTPPVGGKHNGVWLNCGVYTKPVPNENAVHSLEHGAVWITYNPKLVSGKNLKALQVLTPGTYAILSPYPGIKSPIVLSAWGAQLKLLKSSDPRFKAFMNLYRQSPKAPEPGAPCTGDLDAAGKIA